MSRPIRPIAGPFVMPPALGARVRTRLRVSAADEAVLRAIGRHLGHLAAFDLAARVRAAKSDPDRNHRKRGLTAQSTSRWAGTITRTSDDQWKLAWRNLAAERHVLERAIARLEARLAAPVAERDASGVPGYRDRAQRFSKQQRLQVLKSRLARAGRRLDDGRLSICRGGKRLARSRHDLKAAGLVEGEWRERWTAERMFMTADGEHGKRLGNETIRWDPQRQSLEIRLPAPLARLANAPNYRYRIDGVSFHHRADEVAAQTTSGAVRYDISLDAENGRWYLDASWTFRRPAVSLAEARAGGVLGVDLNADHLAAWALDGHGNPIGEPATIALVLDRLSSTRRHGRLRGAISELLHIARRAGLRALVIEDLSFEAKKARSREAYGSGRQGRGFRRMLHGLPTAKFRRFLAQMAGNAGLAVIAIDPAYTSKWGIQHWQKPLQLERRSTRVSSHHSAAVVIGRRGLGYGAKRRIGVTGRQRRHAERRATLQARRRIVDYEGTHADGGRREDPIGLKSPTWGTRTPRTVRGARCERSLAFVRRGTVSSVVDTASRETI